MATSRAIAGAYNPQILWLHPHKVHSAIRFDELEFRMTQNVETCYSIYPTDGASNCALISDW